jgi:hypothetical protein
MNDAKKLNENHQLNDWAYEPSLGKLPKQFLDIQNAIITPSGFKISGVPCRESESEEYGAVQFNLNDKSVAFRVAKTTPTKIGQFVTIWKRENPSDEIAPYDIEDDIDYVFVAVFDQFHKGIFVFEKTILGKKGIMSVKSKGGKRAIRVYAPWINPVSKQAVATRKWQVQHFVSLENMDNAIDEFKRLFNNRLI